MEPIHLQCGNGANDNELTIDTRSKRSLINNR